MFINLMKKAVSKLRQRFSEHTDDFLFIFGLVLVAFGLLLGALALAVLVSDGVAGYLQPHLRERYDVLKILGFCIAGIVSIWLALAANKRANAMDATAKNTEAGQRQERLRNAIEHLGHKRDSVRMGGAYELFHLAKDTEDEDLRQTVMDILCAHIRQMTGGDKYKEKHGAESSEEIQSLLTLLFREKHDVFEDCSIKLQDSYLNGANLSQARLKKANLRQAQLQGANLREAQLQGANLSIAQLQKAVLIKAQLQGTDLREAKLLQEADLSYAKMQNADLSDAQMQGAFLVESQLQSATLEGTQLQGAVLRYAKLQGANLRPKVQGANSRPAQLQKADLTKAQLQGTDLMGARLQVAKLINAKLQGAFLMAARLQGADLGEAQLQGVSSLPNDSIPSAGFESRMINRIGKDSNLAGIIFAGKLKEEDLDALCRGLSDEKAQALREKLSSDVGQLASHELPKNSGAKRGTYTQEEAEKWIAEYNKAMGEASRANDTANAYSAPDNDKDKGD